MPLNLTLSEHAVDVEGALKTFIPFPGGVVVEMHPIREVTAGGVYIPDKSAKFYRPLVGTIVACTPPRGKIMDIVPGDVVIVHPDDGKKIRGFRSRYYNPKQQIRVYRSTSPYHGQALVMPWNESILGKVVMTAIPIQATGDNVLLKLSDIEEFSDGGIVLPTGQQQRPHIAEVLSAGALCNNVYVGQKVLYNRNAVKELDIDGQKGLALISESGILAEVA